MNNREIPFRLSDVEQLSELTPTPFYIYDERLIRETLRNFAQAFSWAPNFKNYFAVKACPNPRVLEIIQQEGGGADCSSMAELVLASRVGFKGSDIMFTSNNTPTEEFELAKKMGAIINADDISHLGMIRGNSDYPEVGCVRFLPSSSDPERQGNNIIGSPNESKFGVTETHILEAYRQQKQMGARRFGIHTMVASNSLVPEFFVQTAEIIFQLVRKISRELDIQFDFVNLGGGLGIPHTPDERPLDLNKISSGIQESYDRQIIRSGLSPLEIYFECGRYITGPAGHLVTKVRHVSEKHKKFAGVDACMANFMRPALYGAYHEISVLEPKNGSAIEVYDVTGSLCENNDKFAIDRPLPQLSRGDTLVIHDSGAHGYSMGFNYNGKLRCAEYLLTVDGRFEQIRRAETLDDYFSTLILPQSN